VQICTRLGRAATYVLLRKLCDHVHSMYPAVEIHLPWPKRARIKDLKNSVACKIAEEIIGRHLQNLTRKLNYKEHYTMFSIN
jgi:hypothetical protein